MNREKANKHLNRFGKSLQTVNQCQYYYTPHDSPHMVSVTYGWLEPYRITSNPRLTGVKLGSWAGEQMREYIDYQAELKKAAQNHPLYTGA